MEIYQRTVTGEIVIGGVNTKVGIGNSGARHVDTVNDLLKEGGRAVVGLDIVSGESGMCQGHCPIPTVMESQRQVVEV